MGVPMLWSGIAVKFTVVVWKQGSLLPTMLGHANNSVSMTTPAGGGADGDGQR